MTSIPLEGSSYPFLAETAPGGALSLQGRRSSYDGVMTPPLFIYNCAITVAAILEH